MTPLITGIGGPPVRTQSSMRARTRCAAPM
jgi:hypothetical protein